PHPHLHSFPNDALPISFVPARWTSAAPLTVLASPPIQTRSGQDRRGELRTCAERSAFVRCTCAERSALPIDANLDRRARSLVARSEEHTSELQSPCNLV